MAEWDQPFYRREDDENHHNALFSYINEYSMRDDEDINETFSNNPENGAPSDDLPTQPTTVDDEIINVTNQPIQMTHEGKNLTIGKSESPVQFIETSDVKLDESVVDSYLFKIYLKKLQDDVVTHIVSYLPLSTSSLICKNYDKSRYCRLLKYDLQSF